MNTNLSQTPEKLPLYGPDALLAHLKALDIEHQVYEHEAVFTVEAANRIAHTMPGAHIRNLFLKDKKGRMFLVSLRDNTDIDLKKLSDLLGAGRFSFGSPDRLWAYLGVRPGSVTPLAILNDEAGAVSLILEKGMMDETLINVHPLINTMTVGMTPQGLMTILENSSKTYQIIDLAPARPDALI